MKISEIINSNTLKASEQFAEIFEIPKEVIANNTLIHMTGNSDIFIENFRGILSYSNDRIVVKGNGLKYYIIGKRLIIVYYTNEDMRISGIIQSIQVSTQ